MDYTEFTLMLLRRKIVDIHNRLLKALRQLSDVDVNWRPNEESNSIANLVAHIAGNLCQRYVAGLGGKEDVRDRDEEFNARQWFTQGHLVELLNKAFNSVNNVTDKISIEDLGQKHFIQNEYVTVLETLFGTVTHMSEHLGQILYVAKIRLGTNYEVMWMPHHRK